MKCETGTGIWREAVEIRNSTAKGKCELLAVKGRMDTEEKVKHKTNLENDIMLLTKVNR